MLIVNLSLSYVFIPFNLYNANVVRYLNLPICYINEGPRPWETVRVLRVILRPLSFFP